MSGKSPFHHSPVFQDQATPQEPYPDTHQTFENHQTDEVVKQTLELQKKLLANTKTEKQNYLALNYQFDAVGSNGLFAASPAIVRFAGFELRKTHTFKVKLINNSPAPQRLHILPPATPYFKIKYHKKGMIPSGISEDIYV
jgi:hypothetical protein